MRRYLAFLVVALVTGCGESASSLQGNDALVRVSNAQFVPGAMPAVVMGKGPVVSGVDSANNTIHAGQGSKAISGRLAKGSLSVAIGFEDDVGHWILPANVPDPLVVGGLQFSSTASFSRRLTPGKHPLIFRAVDDTGTYGEPNPLVLTTQSALPDSDLVVSLTWDTQADLDLHVVDPSGNEVWSRKLSTYKPPSGMPPDPDLEAMAGVLDTDSNSQCVIDGRRNENVVWGKSAPAGHYIVRVDAFSLCGETAARWKVEVRRGVNAQSSPDGELKGSVSGTMLDSDTRYEHAEGKGLLVIEFDNP